MDRRIGRRWTAGAIVLTVVSAPLALQLVAPDAAAAATLPSIQIVQSSTPYDSTATKAVVADCPAGTRVIGGGGLTLKARHVVITGMQPALGTPGSFVVFAAEDGVGTTATWAVTAYAICAATTDRAIDGLQIVTATGPLGSNPSQRVSVPCPAGTSALSVGGTIDGGNGQVALSTDVTGDGEPTGGTATGTEDLDGYAGDWNVTAYAVCAATNPGDLSLVRAQSSDNGANNVNTTEARCPARRRFTGGAGYTSTPGAVVRGVLSDYDSSGVTLESWEQVPSGQPWTATAVAICSS